MQKKGIYEATAETHRISPQTGDRSHCSFDDRVFSLAQSTIDEESPWPRVRSTNGNTVTLHLPQVERWTSNSFTARAAVEVKPAKAKDSALGVIWFEAHGSVDHSSRIVALDRLEITKARFPDATDRGSNALAIVREGKVGLYQLSYSLAWHSM